MTNITPIINAIIALAAAVITVFLVPYLKSKYSAERLTELQNWVTIAVESAEQLFKGTNRGEEKKEYVLNFLSTKGFIIDENSIDNMIEAIVLEINKEAK